MYQPSLGHRQNALRHVLQHRVNIIGFLPQLQGAFGHQVFQVVVDHFEVVGKHLVLHKGIGKNGAGHIQHG